MTALEVEAISWIADVGWTPYALWYALTPAQRKEIRSLSIVKARRLQSRLPQIANLADLSLADLLNLLKKPRKPKHA